MSLFYRIIMITLLQYKYETISTYLLLMHAVTLDKEYTLVFRTALPLSLTSAKGKCSTCAKSTKTSFFSFFNFPFTLLRLPVHLKKKCLSLCY